MDRFLSKENAIKLLETNDTGVLSVVTLENKPYGVSVNYFYDEKTNALYFHSKPNGRKIESIKKNPEVSFIVFDKNEIIVNAYITHYQSTIVTGKATIIEDEEETRFYLEKFCLHTVPDRMDRFDAVVEGFIKNMVMVKVSITAISGKQNKDN
ncbi:MAG: pyridoxamine 5'-phosphate oxidase family protein [Peptostreptococcaceae bacterium]|nr:pyridoxamine 5'-phosphate oxidase family protein [Peptostreptococcaceae bacterium]